MNKSIKKSKRIRGNKNITIINKISHGDFHNTKKPIVVRNYVTALVLSIFLGWLGVDRFYVNHVGLGLIKLFSLGAFGVWWLVDIILFAMRNINYVRFE